MTDPLTCSRGGPARARPSGSSGAAGIAAAFRSGGAVSAQGDRPRCLEAQQALADFLADFLGGSGRIVVHDLHRASREEKPPVALLPPFVGEIEALPAD